MNIKRIWQIIGVGAIVVALIFGINAVTDRNLSVENSSEVPPQEATVTVTIEDLYTDKEVSITSGETVLDVLSALAATDPNVKLQTKEYSGLGVLVERIGEKANGTSDEYWQYKVNGIMPQVGADKLEVQNGDMIEWYFDTSEF